MSVWAIIVNIGTILGVLKSFFALAKEVKDTKSVPDCEHIDTAMDALQKLFEKDFIKIDGVKSGEIAGSIQSIRDQLKCKPK